MTPFEFLLIGHLIGDYLLQTSWMAANKAVKWVPLLTHVTVYTAVIAVVAMIGFGGLSLLGILVVFISHILLDRKGFVQWWVAKVTTPPDSEKKWLTVMTDQAFHIIVLGAVLYL
ncbi:DUF3307 domain-containing protein [Salisediminibacterium selenitireducens]|uniref:DUF3307 domain-containing protein n=1 Tax=Bacillus selenitireducens (strain ATCC 700615 / DSM 15326 / MLS10) TaxID=439292 RepID=D6XYN8_BACIE|nr:DUF3307 domain-containing protein [Salisediminibacterium selenitireducens]ADH98196.1 conserved hypothetical protein [[Bacillus] selenitireducens MLS10]